MNSENIPDSKILEFACLQTSHSPENIFIEGDDQQIPVLLSQSNDKTEYLSDSTEVISVTQEQESEAISFIYNDDVFVDGCGPKAILVENDYIQDSQSSQFTVLQSFNEQLLGSSTDLFQLELPTNGNYLVDDKIDDKIIETSQEADANGEIICQLGEEFLSSISDESYLQTLDKTLNEQVREMCGQMYYSHADVVPVTTERIQAFPVLPVYPYVATPFEMTKNNQLHQHHVKEQQVDNFKLKEQRISSRQMRRKEKRTSPVTLNGERKSANNRERKRMFNINEGFEELRSRVPTFPYEKRLSKIDTLHLAIAYIAFLRDMLESEKHPNQFVKECINGNAEYKSRKWNISDLTTRLMWTEWVR
ncbi:uncharacterized protein LOC120337327 isoform X1 [Styela clava]